MEPKYIHQTNTYTPTPQKSNGCKVISIVFVVLGLILMCFCGALLIFSMKSEKEEKPQTQQITNDFVLKEYKFKEYLGLTDNEAINQTKGERTSSSVLLNLEAYRLILSIPTGGGMAGKVDMVSLIYGKCDRENYDAMSDYERLLASANLDPKLKGEVTYYFKRKNTVTTKNYDTDYTATMGCNSDNNFFINFFDNRIPD